MNIRRLLERLQPTQQAVWLAFIWLFLASVLWIWWDERTMPDLRGEWASADCEDFSGGAVDSRMRRSMRFDEAEWSADLDFYPDKDCATILFSLRMEGPYDLGPKAMSPRDAITARFDRARITLTPRHPEAVTAFERAGCAGGGWSIDEGKEITELGCMNIAPNVSECPTEYDIVKIDDGRLYMGDRSRGVCLPDVYPESFGPMPLARQGSSD